MHVNPGRFSSEASRLAAFSEFAAAEAKPSGACFFAVSTMELLLAFPLFLVGVVPVNWLLARALVIDTISYFHHTVFSE